jgi:excisionase family DNA binding protein
MSTSKTPKAESHQEPVITSAETCDLLRISRPTLHRYVRQKRLLPFRLPGGQLRFKRSEVLALLA